MHNRNLTIIGSYDTRTEVLPVIEQLTNEGYGKDDIVLYANQTVIDQFGLESIDDVEVEHAASEDEDRSLWEKSKMRFLLAIQITETMNMIHYTATEMTSNETNSLSASTIISRWTK